MNSNLVYALSLAIVINCVISVAKNSDEKEVNSSQNLTDFHSHDSNLIGIFSEGNSVSIPSRSKIKARKGAIPDNSTEIVASITPISINQDSPSQNILSNVPVSNSTSNTTIPTSVSNITASVPSLLTSTLKPQHKSSTTKLTTSTTKAPPTTTTKKPIRKPTVSYSADDNAQILESEKNINYNVSKIEDVNVPKTSSDTDRTIILDEENRTRRNYILYMGLAFALPMAFTLIHLTYKKVRNWMEIRHYQRVVS